MWKRTALRAPSRRRRCSRNSCRLLWPWEWRKNGRARSRTSIGSRPSGTAAPYGPNFYTMGFVHDMDQMTTRAGSVLSSAPRSSGGSGFGGGGGSGGGFGGGGGGGFCRGAEELRQVVIPRSLRRRGNSQGAASRANEDTRAG